MSVVKRRLVSATGAALLAFAVGLLPTVAKRAGTTGVSPDAVALDRVESDWESRHLGGGIRSGASNADFWLSRIDPSSNSVELGVAWLPGAFAAPPFIEFTVSTNLSVGAWTLLGWTEAEAGETNLSAEVVASQLPGGTMPPAAFFRAMAYDGLGDDDDDDDGDDLTNAEERALGTNPTNPDSDGDGLPDGWETAYGMDPLASNTGDPRTDASADPDHDGLTNAQEAALGTDPFQPDSDGDGMDDGWESRYGFDPTTHNDDTARDDDDADADPDGDGLTNAEECAWGTNPSGADEDGDGFPDGLDTDRDGVNDGVEIAQGSDPADSTDEGKPNSRIHMTFFFGDHSTSHSEKYQLAIKAIPGSGTGALPRSFAWVNAKYGECETRTAALMPGWSYEVRLAHASTDRPQGADYDYTLNAINIPLSVIVSDPDGLFGVHSSGSTFTGEGLVATLTAYKVDVAVCSPDDPGWAELDVSRVVLDDEELRIKVTVTPQMASLAACRQKFGDSITIKTSGTCPQGATVSLDNAVFSNVDGKSEIRISRSFSQLKQLGLLPQNDEDGINEMAWIDIVQTAGQSYADSEAFSTLGYAFRGKASIDQMNTLESAPPNSVPSESFFKAAGCEISCAGYGGTTSKKCQVMNRADYFYYSGHGSHAAGTLQGGFSPSMVSGKWNGDLDVAVLAGCAVLDVGNYRLKSTGWFYRLKHRKWFDNRPGENWESAGAKFLLGYALKAPLDNDGGAAIASSFVANVKAGQNVIIAWRNANDSAKGRNACVIDCSTSPHVFWYWNETSGVPVWTSITKGATVWPSE